MKSIIRHAGLLVAIVLVVWPAALSAGDGAMQITFEGSSTTAFWSPDGTLIAHMSNRGASGDWNLWTIPAAGGTPTQLTVSPPQLAWPRYSPDGTLVACATAIPSVPPYRIWVIPAEGGAPTQLSDGDWDTEPTWSPDGSQIAFTSSRNGRFGIWVMPGEGGPATQLTSGPRRAEMGPAWSPDGSRIAFVSLREPLGGGIAVIPAGGGAVVMLTDSPYANSDGYPSWSPDGSHIVFSRWSPDSWDDLWIVPADGGTPVPLTDEIGSHEIHPAWSPDGSTIAFTSDRSGANQIWTIPVTFPISIERSSWSVIKGRYRE